MRSIEHMAYAIYLADWQAQYDASGTMLTLATASVQLSWDQLSYEQQQTYKRHAEAVLKHLFEHGRIASYITPERLAELDTEYKAYLEGVGERRLKKEFSGERATKENQD